MALYYELPIYKASYRLLLDLFQITQHFKREFKYTIGQAMKNNAMQMVLFIFKANSTQDKKQPLIELNDLFEMLKLEIRLCVDLHLISVPQHTKLWEQMDVIGKQITGWRKANEK